MLGGTLQQVELARQRRSVGSGVTDFWKRHSSCCRCQKRAKLTVIWTNSQSVRTLHFVCSLGRSYTKPMYVAGVHKCSGSRARVALCAELCSRLCLVWTLLVVRTIQHILGARRGTSNACLQQNSTTVPLSSQVAETRLLRTSLILVQVQFALAPQLLDSTRCQ